MIKFNKDVVDFILDFDKEDSRVDNISFMKRFTGDNYFGIPVQKIGQSSFQITLNNVIGEVFAVKRGDEEEEKDGSVDICAPSPVRIKKVDSYWPFISSSRFFKMKIYGAKE